MPPLPPDAGIDGAAASPPVLLILPGPSKTGTTNIQGYLSSVPLPQWTWPGCPNDKTPGVPAPSDGFTLLPWSLTGQDYCSDPSLVGHDGNGIVEARMGTRRQGKIAPGSTVRAVQTCGKQRCRADYVEKKHADVVRYYADEFQRVKMGLAGRSGGMVIASEMLAGPLARKVAAMRSLLSIAGRNVPGIATGALGGGGGGGDARIVVVVNFRRPRVSHLLSTYNQQRAKIARTVKRGHEVSQNLTLADWMCDTLPSRGFILNPLGLARRILRQMPASPGAADEVLLLDMTGAGRDGMDLTDVLACEVMSVPCTTLEGVPRAPEAKGKRRFNRSTSRRGDGWLPTDATVAAADVPGRAGTIRMSEVGALLHALDCSHADMAADARFSILHDAGIFDGCGGDGGAGPMEMGAVYTALRDMGCAAAGKEIPPEPVLVKNFDGGRVGPYAPYVPPAPVSAGAREGRVATTPHSTERSRPDDVDMRRVFAMQLAFLGCGLFVMIRTYALRRRVPGGPERTRQNRERKAVGRISTHSGFR